MDVEEKRYRWNIQSSGRDKTSVLGWIIRLHLTARWMICAPATLCPATAPAVHHDDDNSSSLICSCSTVVGSEIEFRRVWHDQVKFVIFLWPQFFFYVIIIIIVYFTQVGIIPLPDEGVACLTRRNRLNQQGLISKTELNHTTFKSGV
jgi:hypothetical protein